MNEAPEDGVSAYKLSYSSTGAAAGPLEAKRLARWREEHLAQWGGIDMTPEQERPFSTTLRYLSLGACGVGRAIGSIGRFERHRQRIARDGDDSFTLIVNRSAGETERVTPSQSQVFAAGAASLFDHSRVAAHVCPGGTNVLAVVLPRSQVLRVLPNAEDVVGQMLPPANGALRLLARYARSLLADDGESDPAVLSAAGQGLVDLLALAFAAGSNQREIARSPGLRAVRLHAALDRIRLDYADPDLTPEAVARRVGISTRYLHLLLQETGASFAERVQELRMARALPC